MDLIRPPGTIDLEALCLRQMLFIVLFSPQDLRGPTADRRETLPRDRYPGALHNASPKLWASPRNQGPKYAKFGMILHNLRL